MAAFLNTQLDFIFFFYGLAFILLGGVCFAIRRHSTYPDMWAFLGAFGLIHGTSEWLDLAALVLGDSTVFASFRTGVMTVSFMFLLEFARVGAQTLGWRVPGRWIHVPLFLLVLFGSAVYGLSEANALARYSFGVFGAFGSSLVFASYGSHFQGSHRHLAYSAALAFACYGIAAGLIVPVAPIWPATVLNHAWFTDRTGLPIQLVRGLLACWVAFAVWGIWGQKILHLISAPHYMRHLQRLFAMTMAAMMAILVLGWILTQYLGDIYKQNVEAEANGDIDLVSGYLVGEVAAVEDMAEALAGSPIVRAHLSGRQDANPDWVAESLALDVAAANAESGAIYDAAGRVVFSTGRHIAAHPERDIRVQRALEGNESHAFTYRPADREMSFFAIEPVKDADGSVLGAVSLERTLNPLAKRLQSFDRPLAFVDPNGIVVLSNRPDWTARTLWPVASKGFSKDSGRSGTERPILADEVTSPDWALLDGSRAFIQRKPLKDSGWSIVLVSTAPGIFASRVLGIAMTLMATGMVLVYLAGRERHIYDSFQKDQRLELEELARDLRFKATTDPLTGLPNRLKLNHRLDHELARAARYGSPLSFVIFDVDRFKRINDNHGHPVGDKVLIALSDIAKAAIRKTDLLARWGGEEFAIVVPEAKLGDAAALAHALRAKIERHAFDPKIAKITCSFGVAQYCPGDTAESLVARADQALYRAKMNGRNRVDLAPAPSPARPSVGRVA